MNQRVEFDTLFGHPAARSIRESVPARALARAIDVWTSAWRNSRVRAAWCGFVPAADSGRRAPFAAVAAATASLTALALRAAGTRPDPLTWVVPVAVLVTVIVISSRRH